MADGTNGLASNPEHVHEVHKLTPSLTTNELLLSSKPPASMFASQAQPTVSNLEQHGIQTPLATSLLPGQIQVLPGTSVGFPVNSAVSEVGLFVNGTGTVSLGGTSLMQISESCTSVPVDAGSLMQNVEITNQIVPTAYPVLGNLDSSAGTAMASVLLNAAGANPVQQLQTVQPVSSLNYATGVPISSLSSGVVLVDNTEVIGRPIQLTNNGLIDASFQPGNLQSAGTPSLLSSSLPQNQPICSTLPLLSAVSIDGVGLSSTAAVASNVYSSGIGAPQLISPMATLPGDSLTASLNSGVVNTVVLHTTTSGQQLPIQITGTTIPVLQGNVQTMGTAITLPQAVNQMAQPLAGQSVNLSVSSQGKSSASPVVHVQKEGAKVEFVQLHADNVKQVKPGVFTFSMPKGTSSSSASSRSNNSRASSSTASRNRPYVAKQVSPSLHTISVSSAAQILVPALGGSKEQMPGSSASLISTQSEPPHASQSTEVTGSISQSEMCPGNAEPCLSTKEVGTETKQMRDCGTDMDVGSNGALSANAEHNGPENAAEKPTDSVVCNQNAIKSIVTDDQPQNEKKPGKRGRKRGRKKKSETAAPRENNVDLPRHLKTKIIKKEHVIDLTKHKLRAPVSESDFMLDETIDELYISKLKLSELHGWVCSLCRRPGYVANVGRLFGPYQLRIASQDNTTDQQDKLLSSVSSSKQSDKHIKIWLHMDCAIWTHCICLSEQKLVGVEEALRTGIDHNCDLCSSSGATLGCAHFDCKHTYHYICARQTGCSFREDSFTIYCPKHK